MGKYKLTGGLGYIFMIIPVLNFLGAILISFAWYSLGSREQSKLFKLNGLLPILCIMILFGGYALLQPYLSILASGGMAPYILLIGSFTWSAAMLAVLASYFIVDVYSHVKASKKFEIKWFKYAGGMRISFLIFLILTAVLLSILSQGVDPLKMGLEAFIDHFYPALATMLISLLSLVFGFICSAISFFLLDKKR